MLRAPILHFSIILYFFLTVKGAVLEKKNQLDLLNIVGVQFLGWQLLTIECLSGK